MSSYIPIASQTLGSSASSVTFSSIPTTLNGKTLRDLVLVFNAEASGAYQLTGDFNSDAGSNYNWVNMTGTGSSATSGGFNNFTYALFYHAALPAALSSGIIQVLDFAQTNKHKSWLTRAGNANSFGVGADAGRWASTSAITSMTLKPGANTWSTGSTFSLYGIEG